MTLSMKLLKKSKTELQAMKKKKLSITFKFNTSECSQFVTSNVT